METKTEKVRKLFKDGNVKEALRMAKTFRIGLTKDERDSIVRAYECMVYPDFYLSIGKNPNQEIKKGIEVFKQKILA